MRPFTGLAVVLSLATSWPPVAAGSHDVKNYHARKRLGPEHHLGKRFENARFTFYEDGLGACGKTNAPGDYIVALNSAQYAGGGHCFDMITITANGKTTQAQIVDECPGCPYGGLDFSEGLFDFFASEDAGVIYGSWEFGSAPAPSPAPEPTTSEAPKPAPPTTTYTPPPPTTTTSKKPHTTTTQPPPEPTTSSAPHTTSTSTTPTTSSAPPTTSSAPPPTTTMATSVVPTTASITDASVATAGPIAGVDEGNIYQFNLALIQLGIMLDDAAAL
ncbi:Non-catalytic module family EXPN protein [Heterobasidion irregulare TC 32-1]|uniref:Non-catalytic module family EXPN protein n=1 Tax=Heterobasidion irregulare (strain TC 32-1) TaxID=747525 RepID=W4KKA0_HETIT|nr:Non-catalytic module family EXPN protein [Heterobasidion irregulare TC 32-1]ETW85481.1 Non-catalytic module family EXPN protein [Heterobasidion irregulare TC 32-1]